MLVSNLYQQFEEKFRASRLFKLSNVDEQETILKDFLIANNDQLIQAIQKIEQDDIDLAQYNSPQQESSMSQMELLREIQKETVIIQKETIRYASENERKMSSDAAELLIEKLVDEAPKPKKKKIFGLF